MNTAQKLTGFTAGLGVVFAAALGLGATVGPIGTVAAHTPDTHHPAAPFQAPTEDRAALAP